MNWEIGAGSVGVQRETNVIAAKIRVTPRLEAVFRVSPSIVMDKVKATTISSSSMMDDDVAEINFNP